MRASVVFAEFKHDLEKITRRGVGLSVFLRTYVLVRDYIPKPVRDPAETDHFSQSLYFRVVGRLLVHGVRYLSLRSVLPDPLKKSVPVVSRFVSVLADEPESPYKHLRDDGERKDEAREKNVRDISRLYEIENLF